MLEPKQIEAQGCKMLLSKKEAELLFCHTNPSIEFPRNGFRVSFGKFLQCLFSSRFKHKFTLSARPASTGHCWKYLRLNDQGAALVKPLVPATSTPVPRPSTKQIPHKVEPSNHRSSYDFPPLEIKFRTQAHFIIALSLPFADPAQIETQWIAHSKAIIVTGNYQPTLTTEASSALVNFLGIDVTRCSLEEPKGGPFRVRCVLPLDVAPGDPELHFAQSGPIFVFKLLPAAAESGIKKLTFQSCFGNSSLSAVNTKDRAAALLRARGTDTVG